MSDDRHLSTVRTENDSAIFTQCHLLCSKDTP